MDHQKKKLCIILPQHWSFLMGGCQYQIKCLLENIAACKAFEISILSRRLNENFKPVDYHLQYIVKPHTLQRYAHFLDAPFLWKTLKKLRPDVIYQNIGTSYAGVAAHYARRHGCKMVLHIASDIDVVPHKWRRRARSVIHFIEKLFFDHAIRNAHVLIAQTQMQEKLIYQHYSRNVDAVIPNFQPIPAESISKQAPIKVVWVANFKPLKQPEIFASLAEDLSNSNIPLKFIMIGKPSPEKSWQRRIEKRLKRIPSLTYLGPRPVDEVNRILSGAHILVNTSKYEGFSNTFIQAWMRAMPVVSLSSNPDGLLSGTRMGFASGTYEQLYRDVSRLIHDDKFRECMGKDAQSYAFEHYSLRNTNEIFQYFSS